MSDGYEVLSLDDLDRLESTDGQLTLLPLRRTVGFRPFGVNAWLGAKAGDQVIERHREQQSGDEELYVVVRGRATFTLGDETFDAPPGTLVHAPPGTLREAIAADDDTVVLAMGAKPGEAFQPSAWEDFYVAFALRAAGRVEEARALIAETLARNPGTWQGPFNVACFEALEGDDDAAFEQLRIAYERAPAVIAKYAPDDGDLARLKDDSRWQELFG
ncbi:MAG: TPR end-of-group domain-containing protein [Gaiellaceae bacterium]